MLWKTAAIGTQICITNGGGIRASIATGNITLGQATSVLPFGNTVATLGLVGSDVIAALENGVSQWRSRLAASPRWRACATASTRPARPATASYRRSEEPGWQLQPHRANDDLPLTTNDFMRRGGDGYSVFATNAINPYDTWAVMPTRWSSTSRRLWLRAAWAER